MALSRYVPAAWPSTMNPASMASAPAPVISSAWSAAARAFGDSWSWPISRNDVTDVSSQKPYRMSRLSASTRPTMAPAKSTSSPSRRPLRGVGDEK